MKLSKTKKLDKIDPEEVKERYLKLTELLAYRNNIAYVIFLREGRLSTLEERKAEWERLDREMKKLIPNRFWEKLIQIFEYGYLTGLVVPHDQKADDTGEGE